MNVKNMQRYSIVDRFKILNYEYFIINIAV